MQKNPEIELAKLEATVKVWHEYQTTSNEDYGVIILRTVNILLDLTNSLHTNKIQLPPWKVWSEPIIFKLCYHVSSLIKLCSGTELPFKKGEDNIIIFDEPSVIILFRTILENYLTFFYLFIDKVAEDEKEFRMLIWRFCGLKQRTEFIINTEKEKEKQKLETQTVEELKNEILSNPIFQNYNIKQRKLILNGRNPRLFDTWKSLIVRSNLNTELFQNLYGYKSNYTHTEFISVLQLHEGQYGHHKENTRGHYLMLLLNGLLGKLILELKEYFPSIKEIYEAKDLEVKCEIAYLSQLSSN